MANGKLTNAIIAALVPGQKPVKAGAKKNDVPRSTGKPYRMIDSTHLYLIVLPSGIKRWEYRYPVPGKSAPSVVSLGHYSPDPMKGTGIDAARRERTRLDSERLLRGIDPRNARKIARLQQEVEIANLKALRAQQRYANVFALPVPASLAAVAPAPVYAVAAAPGMITVRALVTAWQAADRACWTSEESYQQMTSTFERVVFPLWGERAAESITTPDVLAVIEELLVKQGKYTPAKRLAGWLKRAWDYGKPRQLVTHNPVYEADKDIARMKALHRSANKSEPRKCVDESEVGALVHELRTVDATAVQRALVELLIYTGLRREECAGGQWSEIDFANARWTIPAARMKEDKEHEVELSTQAMAILHALRAANPKGNAIFAQPGDGDASISGEAALKLVRKSKFSGKQDVHGFRSMLCTLVQNHEIAWKPLALKAIAHASGDEACDAVYVGRAKLYGALRTMMQWYADELDRRVAMVTGANVVAIKAS